MGTPTCIIQAGSGATGFADSKELNRNYLSEFNYRPAGTGVIPCGRGPSNGTAFSESLSAKESPSVAFVEETNDGRALEMAPNWNKSPQSPLLFKAGIEVHSLSTRYRSPTRGLKKIFSPAITPLGQKTFTKEVSPSISDLDILRLDCSEDDLALIRKLSDEEDEDILNLSKEEEDALLKSEDEEELSEMRHYLLESRGKRNLPAVEQQNSLKSVEDDLLKPRDDEELLKSDLSDVDADLEERLLKSDDEEPLENYREEERKTEDVCPNTGEEAGGTCAVIESSENIEEFDCRLVVDDEGWLLRGADSESGEARDDLLVSEKVSRIPKAKHVSEVRDPEEELSEDEQTVRLTEDGNMVFSEHSDDEDDIAFLEEEGKMDGVVEDNELKILFVQKSEVKLGSEIVNEPLNCALRGGVQLPVNLNGVEDLSAEKEGSVKIEQLAQSHSSETLSQGAAEFSRNAVEVWKVDDEVDFKLAMSSDSGVDLFSQGDESSRSNEDGPIEQQLVEDEDITNVQVPSSGVDRTEQSFCQLVQDSDGNTLNEGYTKDVHDVEIVEEPSGSRRKDVSVFQNCEKVEFSQLFKLLVSQYVEVAVTQRVEQVSVPRNLEEVSVSQNLEEVSVSQNLEEVSVSQNLEEVSVSQNLEEVSVSQNLEEVSASQKLQEVSAFQKLQEVSAFQKLQEVSASQKLQEVSVSQNLEVSIPPNLEEVSIPPNLEEVSIPQNHEEVSVSQNLEEVSVSQNLEEVPVSQNLEEVSVSQNLKGVSVSQNLKGVSVSQNLKGVSVSQNLKGVSVSQNLKGVSVSQKLQEVSVSQNFGEVPVFLNVKEVLLPASQPIDVVGSQRIEVVGSLRNDVPISQLLEQAVSQRVEVVSSHQEGNVPQLARTEKQLSQSVLQSCECSAFQRVDGAPDSQRVEVPILQHGTERVSQREDNLFTRRDGRCRQSLNDSSTGKMHRLLANPIPSLSQTNIIATPQPSATFTRHNGIYPYQESVIFPSHQGPIVWDRWGSQQAGHNYYVSGSLGANADFSSDLSADNITGNDFIWNYQHCPYRLENHIPNGSPDSSKLFPNAPSTSGLDFGHAADSTVQFGGAQTSPKFLADETSMDKPAASANNNSKPYNDHFKEDEIQDNNDPRWEEIRSLKTDAERYASLLERWGNAAMPDPRKNLTTHNYLLRKRVRNLQAAEARTPVFTNGRKRKASSALLGERPGKRLCSILDEKFADVERRTSENIGRINDERLLHISKVEQERQEAISIFVKAYGPNFLNDDYFSELEYKTFQRKEEINNYFGKEVEVVLHEKAEATKELESALNEMEAFYKFYGDDSNADLTPEEVDIFVEQERMFSVYGNFYVG